MMFEQHNWYGVRSGDVRALNIFLRHYSARRWRDRSGVNGARFVSPGEHMILMTSGCDALFVWVREMFRLDEQTGVCCSVFRNESNILASTLILEAEQLAWERWPGERLFTYVNAKMVRSVNPGYCFKRAGWRVCGTSKAKKLVILEKCQRGSCE